MNHRLRIERSLDKSLQSLEGGDTPPLLREAIRYAVFPGGSRVRPALTLGVAAACGSHDGQLADRAAAAIELLHCASLVHDDLPCFDDAATRRGLPSVHARFGEALAVLAGDALIVHALDALCELVPAYPRRGPIALRVVAAGVGAVGGIIAGQAWESEPSVDLRRYQRAKTGALFEAAILAGAASAGQPLERWRNMGRLLGEAYQIADDIADVFADGATLGKPVGQDRAHARPSALRELDIETATRRLNDVLEAAREAVPPCSGRDALRERFSAITTAHLARIGPPRGATATRSRRARN